MYNGFIIYLWMIPPYFLFNLHYLLSKVTYKCLENKYMENGKIIAYLSNFLRKMYKTVMTNDDTYSIAQH